MAIFTAKRIARARFSFCENFKAESDMRSLSLKYSC